MGVKKAYPLLINVGKDLYKMVGSPRVSSWQSKDRPENPSRGMLGFNTQTNELEYFDGNSWYATNMSRA